MRFSFLIHLRPYHRHSGEGRGDGDKGKKTLKNVHPTEAGRKEATSLHPAARRSSRNRSTSKGSGGPLFSPSVSAARKADKRRPSPVLTASGGVGAAGNRGTG
jgi:hypothetical protein